MDTTHLEYTAEDLISHQLMRSGILVAKPKFDREGTDLLAFVEIGDGVKFCRIQCKGRSLVNSKSTNIKIPKSYVTGGFVVFLYVEDTNVQSELYAFLQVDIESWPQNNSSEYVLSLNASTHRKNLAGCRFDASKIELIRLLISNAETSGEFNKLSYSSARITLPILGVSGTATN